MKFCPECGAPVTDKVIDGASRFVCTNPNCNSIHWNNPVPVVAALVNCSGKYVIAHNVKWPKGVFSLITGYLEADEEAESAVLREVEEELGLQGRIVRFLGNHSFREKNQVIMAYEVEAEGEIALNEELSEVKQLTKDELAGYDFRPLYVTEKIIETWKTGLDNLIKGEI